MWIILQVGMCGGDSRDDQKKKSGTWSFNIEIQWRWEELHVAVLFVTDGPRWHTIVACPNPLLDFLQCGEVELDGVWSPEERKRTTSAKLVLVHALKLIYHDLHSLDIVWWGTQAGPNGQMISGTSIFGLDLKFHARNGWKMYERMVPTSTRLKASQAHAMKEPTRGVLPSLGLAC